MSGFRVEPPHTLQKAARPRSHAATGSDSAPRPRGAAVARSPSFADVLASVAEAHDRGEKRIQEVICHPSRDMPPQAALVLQAEVYRYARTVETTAKVVESMTTGARTLLSGN